MLFIHSPADGHAGGFPFGIVMDNASVKMYLQVFV